MSRTATPHPAVKAFWLLPVLLQPVQPAEFEVGVRLYIPGQGALHNLAVEQAVDKQAAGEDNHTLALVLDKAARHKPVPTDRAAFDRRFGVVVRNMMDWDIREAEVGRVGWVGTARDWSAETHAPGASRCGHKNTTARFLLQ